MRPWRQLRFADYLDKFNCRSFGFHYEFEQFLSVVLVARASVGLNPKFSLKGKWGNVNGCSPLHPQQLSWCVVVLHSLHKSIYCMYLYEHEAGLKALVLLVTLILFKNKKTQQFNWALHFYLRWKLLQFIMSSWDWIAFCLHMQIQLICFFTPCNYAKLFSPSVGWAWGPGH